MVFYIKEWADKSATLITREGHQLFTFRDVDSALAACSQWYRVSAHHVIPHVDTDADSIRPPLSPLHHDQTAA